MTAVFDEVKMLDDTFGAGAKSVELSVTPSGKWRCDVRVPNSVGTINVYSAGRPTRNHALRTAARMVREG